MKGDTLAGPLEMTVYSALQKLYEIENTKKLKRPHLSVVKERTRPSSDSEAATVYKLKRHYLNMQTGKGLKYKELVHAHCTMHIALCTLHVFKR